MSVRVMSAFWEIPLPPIDKLVLLALADAANDEGHCWPSIATIARKSGVSERSVQRAIRKAESSGMIERKEVIGKGCKYHLTPRHTVTPAAQSPVTETTETPDTQSPKPLRTTKSSEAKASSVRARRIPENWSPEKPYPPAVSTLLDEWPPGRVDRELDGFRDYWATRQRDAARTDWDKTWWNRIRDQHDRVLRDARNGQQRTHPLGRHQPSDGLSSTARAAIAVFGAPSASR